jgi:uncharacterized membrane-anchored protein YhcB (DUF1043 family)
MFKDLRNKIKLLKKLSALAKELKKVKKENEQTFDEIAHFLESAKLLYPKLGGLLEDIIELAKSDNNKKV